MLVERSRRREGRGDRSDVQQFWEYAPTAKGKVVVEVRDLAGNVVEAELNV